MRIIIGADHGGFVDKEKVAEYLKSKGFEVVDVGAHEVIEDDDFVDYAKNAMEVIKEGDKVLLFCRNGFGMSITANRYRGIRCGLGFNREAVERGRMDDDINCLSIPSDYLSPSEVINMVEAFIETDFSDDERYRRRILKIDNI